MPATVRLPGLSRPARLVRDRRGVPHVFAANATDAYRALGYSMASDRLWQMDLMRRLGQGRVAEILGRPFLVIDALAHTLGFPDTAARAELTLGAEARSAIEAFTAGVNVRIDAGDLPPEFAVLGYTPDRWRVIDSIAIEYLVGFLLSLESLEPKLVLARALGRLGAERGAWLYPRPLPTDLLDAERLSAYRDLDLGLFAALATLTPPPMGGSNAWAVAPRLTARRATLVAGDPHLLHAAPGPWYLVHLSAPDLEIAGAVYLGGPVVQVGRNRRGAWSVTNLTADDADIVVERLHPEDATRYEVGPQVWERIVERVVPIPVRGEEPYSLTVRTTRHGPLLDGIATVLGLPSGPPYALKWKATSFPGNSLNGWVAVHASRGLDDVLRAAPLFDGAPFETNMIYGDADGHIAHLALGGMPRRSGTQGLVPALGWRDDVTWEGLGSLGATPWKIDPPGGVVWTANERTGAADRATGGDGQPFGEHPYRARRIHDTLAAGKPLDVDAFAALQIDDLDLAAQSNLPVLRDAFEGWQPADPALAEAVALLLAWDGRTNVDSPAAAFYHVLVFAEWLPSIFPEAELPGLAQAWRTAYWGAEAILQAPRSPWLADGREKTTLLRACATRALARLQALAGDRPRDWRWGPLHQARFVHPLAFAPGLEAGALPPVPVGGSPFTPNQQRFAAATPPFGSMLGAGVRMVTDLGDADRMHIVLSTGESGDPRSPHFADQLPAWRSGTLSPLVLNPAHIEVESEESLEP